jgi:SpoVK/Ycf46/Vps4 family AAA+-type ATPase
MARADLILNLVKAATRSDQAQVQKTVEALAADERAKNHGVLADRLVAQLREINGNGNGGGRTISNGLSRPSSGPLIAEKIPSRSLQDLILASETEQIVRELLEEQFRADLLRSFSLEPRNRVLLTGPPGNGKTTLAEAIANELNLPFLVVRYESVIGSYLGETAQRISQVFELARSQKCVLFFDEFDAVGKERGDVHETGEIKRVVSSLLLQIDALPSYVVVVTASNHPELLDRAVWRRFQVRLNLPLPGQAQIAMWLQKFERRLGQTMPGSSRLLTQRLAGLSFAEIEEFGLDILRRSVLSDPAASLTKMISDRLNFIKKSAKPAMPRKAVKKNA